MTFLSGGDKRGITVNYVSPSFCSDPLELIILSGDIWDTSDLDEIRWRGFLSQVTTYNHTHVIIPTEATLGIDPIALQQRR